MPLNPVGRLFRKIETVRPSALDDIKTHSALKLRNAQSEIRPVRDRKNGKYRSFASFWSKCLYPNVFINKKSRNHADADGARCCCSRVAVDNLCDSLYSRATSMIRLRQLVEFKCLCGHDPGLCLDPLETPRGVLAENRTHAVFALRGYVKRIK